MNPQTPIENLPGIGSYYGRKLKKLEINTLEDLIYHFPFRYDDFSKIAQIQNLTPGEKISIQGVIWQIRNIRTRRGKFVTTATIADQSGTIEVIWFNQPYLTKTLKAGLQVSLSGKVQQDGNKIKLVSPSYEILRSQQTQVNQPNRHPGVATTTIGSRDSVVKFTPNQREILRSAQDDRNEGLQNDKVDGPSTLHTGRLVPIYPETEGLSSKWLRGKIAAILPAYLKTQKDFLPQKILESQKMIPLDSALTKVHFPRNYQDVETSRRRLAFDELFLTQLMSQMRKRQWAEERSAPKMHIPKVKLASFIKSLPFALTGAQNKAIAQIIEDLKKPKPANRLLEGDVGSGKTVVAACAALVAHTNNFDTLLAAPTEILAFQHHQTLTKILKPFATSVGIWTGSKKQKGNIVCGTHALLTTFKAEREVGLVVVDEQHRFGVAQRAKLFLDQSEEFTPHLLTMTATPIPRTLALTLYGDLDLSVLDEMPAGRQKIATFVVPNHKRTEAYKFIEKQIEEGRQAFIITPFVEPSESMNTVKAAIDEFEKLKKIFSDILSSRAQRSDPTRKIASSVTPHNDRNNAPIKLGLLHGRLKSKEKELVIDKFRSNKIHILVATPVVEVGIDVPNATIMLIESAERFGLAQLHQLRGRVGRGKHKSYCFLFTDSQAENSIKRLKSMEKIAVGFKLAEIDLKMRGAGEIFGLKQSGFLNFKVADLSDRVTIVAAQNQAHNILIADHTLKKFPALHAKLETLKNQYSQPN